MTSCRTCLRQDRLPADGSWHQLFADSGRSQLNLLRICTSLPFEQDDGLPAQICDECHTNLTALLTFRAQAIEADREYRSRICNQSDLLVDIKHAFEFIRGQTVAAAADDVATKNECMFDYLEDEEKPIVKRERHTNSEDEHASNSRSSASDSDDSDYRPPSAAPPLKLTTSTTKRKRHESPATEAATKNDANRPIVEQTTTPTPTTNKPPTASRRSTKGQRRPIDKSQSFTCDLCAKRYFNKTLLAGHLRQHLGLRPFVCDECGREFRRHCNMLVHKQTHLPDEPTECAHEGCGKRFRQPRFAKDHYERVHLGMRPKRVADCICDVCGQQCATMNVLQAHMNRHVDLAEFPWQCRFCNKRFRQKGNYEIHVKRHENVRNFPCPVCPQRMVSRTEYTVHMRRHERKIRCEQCSEAFQSKVSLQTHVLIAHQGREAFTCRYCGRQFTKVMSMRYHERTHTGEKPCPCTVCHMRFPNPRMLNAHVQRYH